MFSVCSKTFCGGFEQPPPQETLVLPQIYNLLLPPGGNGSPKPLGPSALRRDSRPPLTTPVFTILVPSKIRVVLAEKQRTTACQPTGKGGIGRIAKQLLNIATTKYVCWAQAGVEATRLVCYYSPYPVLVSKDRFVCL